MSIRKFNKRGFTLVELMIVVAIIGVLAALAIYGVRRYVYSSKTAEAKTAVGRIAKDASSAYNAEAMPGTIVAMGSAVDKSNALCAGASAPVPATVPAGQKYQSSPAEWQPAGDQSAAGQRSKGWLCLGFSMQDPQMYRYNYTTSANLDATGATFSAIAEGDLNGDTVTSKFSLAGSIQADAAGSLALTVAPNFIEENALE